MSGSSENGSASMFGNEVGLDVSGNGGKLSVGAKAKSGNGGNSAELASMSGKGGHSVELASMSGKGGNSVDSSWSVTNSPKSGKDGKGSGRNSELSMKLISTY